MESPIYNIRMDYQYITALLLAEGSEGPVEKYIHTMIEQNGFAYPLPLMIPLAGFSSSFPPDRVDRKKLKELENLQLYKTEKTDQGTILSLKNPELAEQAAACLKGIHGKPAPPRLDSPLFQWKGILLHPAGFPYEPDAETIYPPPPELQWKTYRYGLFRISWKPGDPWWNHIRWELLWHIRKPRKTN